LKHHRDKRLAVLVVNLVDGADVGMVERGGRLGFALKTFERLGIRGEIFRQNFNATKRRSLVSSAL